MSKLVSRYLHILNYSNHISPSYKSFALMPTPLSITLSRDASRAYAGVCLDVVPAPVASMCHSFGHQHYEAAFSILVM